METVLIMIIKRLESGDIVSAKKYAQKFISEIDDKELDKDAVKKNFDQFLNDLKSINKVYQMIK